MEHRQGFTWDLKSRNQYPLKRTHKEINVIDGAQSVQDLTFFDANKGQFNWIMQIIQSILFYPSFQLVLIPWREMRIIHTKVSNFHRIMTLLQNHVKTVKIGAAANKYIGNRVFYRKL